MLKCDTQGEIAILTLARPERRNALALEMIRAMHSELDRLARSPVKVIILAADGSVFCSGHDLKELTARSDDEYREIFETCSRMMLRLHDIPQPIIAEVQGVATAAGCQLVAACDLAIAAESATFATPGVRIGLFCSTPMVPLVRAIGRKRAMEMLLTGDSISASTALEWGLVNRVVPAQSLRECTLELAQKIASASPLTLATGKRAFYGQIDRPETAAYLCANEAMTENSMAADAQEGISAFLNKRRPAWTGR